MFRAELAMRKGLRRKREAGEAKSHDEIVREGRAGGSETGRSQRTCVEEDESTVVPGEPSKSDDPDTGACSTDAPHVIDVGSMDRGARSEMWAPAKQVPDMGDLGLVSGCDAIKEHGSREEGPPAKRCAVSLPVLRGSWGRERNRGIRTYF